MNKLSQKRLVDGLMDACVSWREACVRVSDAYRSWASETDLGDMSAFGRDTGDPASVLPGVIASLPPTPAVGSRADLTAPHWWWRASRRSG
jgi:hypothetical protein